MLPKLILSMCRASGAPRQGPGGALMAPRLRSEPPLEIVSARVRLALFRVLARTPPGNPIWQIYTYFQRFFISVASPNGPKWPPRGPPCSRARAPRAPPRPPEKCNGPLGPNRAPWAAENPLLMNFGRPIQVKFGETKSMLPLTATATNFEN